MPSTTTDTTRLACAISYYYSTTRLASVISTEFGGFRLSDGLAEKILLTGLAFIANKYLKDNVAHEPAP
jgi:hypothetical protein